jgi:ribonuclease E
MKRMLFNATQSEELRVAIVDGQKLIDLDIESSQKEQRKGSIFKGVITRIEPSLEACFVDYGTERHGFLPFKEVSKIYFQDDPQAQESGRPRPQTGLKEGQEILVQVDKDERGSKGAALTSFISLAGRYLVLMPNNPRGGGVSRRIEGDERTELKETLAHLTVPQGMSLIARTAGIGRSSEELQWDLDYLIQLWQAIESASIDLKAPALIYQESSLVIRAIRDYFQPDIGEILIDTPDIYEQAKQFMGHVMPQNVARVHFYDDDVPLFSRFQIEHQIETAHSRQVALSSGGAIVIDHTEALVAIDVNSARATRGADIETTACHTNLEAAEEIARQLRLRDLGGLIVIDFIDMENPRHQRDVENRLRDALRYDRARVQVGRISRFGLLELSRQRLRPSLGESTHITCPRCDGLGHIRGTESIALHVLRLIQEEALKGHVAQLIAQVPVDVGTYLLNEKRTEVHELETRLKMNIVLIPNKHLETPNYQIQRIKHDDLKHDSDTPSFMRTTKPIEEVYVSRTEQMREPKQEAIVKGITPQQPAPQPSATVGRPNPQLQGGILHRLWSWLVGEAPLADASTRQVAARQSPNLKETAFSGQSTPRQSSSRSSQSSGQANQANHSEPSSRDTGRKPSDRYNREPRQSPRSSNTERPEKDMSREPREPRESRDTGNRSREARNERPARTSQREEITHSSAAPIDTPIIVSAVPLLSEQHEHHEAAALTTQEQPSTQRRQRTSNSGQAGTENPNRRKERSSHSTTTTNRKEATHTSSSEFASEEHPALSSATDDRHPSSRSTPSKASESAVAETVDSPSHFISQPATPAVMIAPPPPPPSLLSEKDVVGLPPKAEDLPSHSEKGLVMVETTSAETPAEAPAIDAVVTPRGRKVARKKVSTEAAPMMQVETQHLDTPPASEDKSTPTQENTISDTIPPSSLIGTTPPASPPETNENTLH